MSVTTSAIATKRIRTLERGRKNIWRASVTGEVRPRLFPADHEAEDVLFALELEGFAVDHMRKRFEHKKPRVVHA